MLILDIKPNSPSNFVNKKNGNSAGSILVAHTVIPFREAVIAVSGINTKLIINKSKKAIRVQ